VGERPTGTVTFLFTDIEGSTRLLHELGDAYADVLAEHRRVLREAFVRHGGVEVDTQGDAFFFAFTKASDALAGAAAARDGLADGPIRVRMGLHTGEPLATDEGYVGIDVHRAARIAAAGHGGQILVSQSTRDLAGDNGLRDLGEHRLKDLTAPERIFQLGDGEFPALKTLNRSNLPLVSTPLIGREREVAEVATELVESRIVTITGPGGIGKTRLALQVAAEVRERFADGVFWIPLAALRDSSSVFTAAAQSLGVQEASEAALADYLQSRSLLLVFDNAEHLDDAGLSIAELQRDSGDARVLVTSRSPLHVTAETEYTLDPLTLSSSVALFATRARGLRRDIELDAVEAICRRLDGLPLAVELAAARTKILSPRAIRDRLEHRLPVLVGGPRDAPARQQTLAATIGWSYDLLDEREQDVFRRFAVFVGGADVEAAEVVTGATLDELASLVDKSLLKSIGDDRFLMLETVREYARDQLDAAGDADETERRHAAAYLTLAERVSPELWRTGQAQWLELLEADRPNLDVAFRWFLERGESVDAARLAAALWNFWYLTGASREGSEFLASVLRHEDEFSPLLRARVVYAAGHLCLPQGRLDEAEPLLARGVELLRDVGDVEQLGWAVLSCALLQIERGNFAAARDLQEQSLVLFREAGSVRGVAFALNDLAIPAIEAGDLQRAHELFSESRRLSESVGDAFGAANATAGVADTTLEVGNVEEAERLYGSALSQFAAISSRYGCVEALDGLAANGGRWWRQ
jgi:predicted ATPase/class 3 adenylate cyclase